MKKLSVIVLLCLLTVWTLSGCGGGGAPAPPVVKNVAYIYNPAYPTESGDESETVVAQAFETLLDATNPTDLIGIATLTDSTDLSKYSVIIISRNVFLDSAQSNKILATGIPVIGIHRGGLRHFTNINISIKSGLTASGSYTNVYVVNASHQVWSTPNPLSVTTGGGLAVYTDASHAAVYYPTGNLAAGGVQIAMEAWPGGYNTIVQDGENLYWAFWNSPSTFTSDGQKLFKNIVAYMAQ